MQLKTEAKPCLCGEPGERDAIEILPDGGTLMMVVHDTGKVCKWAEGYRLALDTTTESDHVAKKFGRTEVTCPACGSKGAATTFAKDKRIPYVLEYYIRHETLNEKWAHGRTKERRCTKFTQEQRDEILKQLGRYISTPRKVPQLSHIKKKTSDKLQKSYTMQNPSSETKKEYGDEYIFKPGSATTYTKKTKGFRQVQVRNKRLAICSVCNKPGYSYKTYYQHYNEPPVGKVLLKGDVIGDKFRRCYLPKDKAKVRPKKGNSLTAVSQQITRTREYMSPLVISKQLKSKRITATKNDDNLRTLDSYVKNTNLSEPKESRPSNRNVECPDCHQLGVLNVATNKDDLERISFYVRHEKLAGTWGNKSKVSKYRRCYISRINKKQMKYLKEIWNNLSN